MEKPWLAQRCAPRVRPEATGQNAFPRNWKKKNVLRQVSASVSYIVDLT